jgi:hypothetical protein
VTKTAAREFPGGRLALTDMHLQIGSLLFEGLDQIDLTGPFEVFSRIPD